MIVVDSSALVAVLQRETGAEGCATILGGASRVVMTAATLVEALIVAGQRGFRYEMAALVGRLGIEIVAVDSFLAREAADAYRRFGRGNHPARLNFGDCFSYALARSLGWPLLYVGGDFGRTDVATARR